MRPCETTLFFPPKVRMTVTATLGKLGWWMGGRKVSGQTYSNLSPGLRKKCGLGRELPKKTHGLYWFRFCNYSNLPRCLILGWSFPYGNKHYKRLVSGICRIGLIGQTSTWFTWQRQFGFLGSVRFGAKKHDSSHSKLSRVKGDPEKENKNKCSTIHLSISCSILLTRGTILLMFQKSHEQLSLAIYPFIYKGKGGKGFILYIAGDYGFLPSTICHSIFI